MNNKLFKTAVVLVTIACMLCSFASAATINSLSCSEAKDKISMNVVFADDATRGAYIAYAAKMVEAGTEGAEVIDEKSFILGPIVAIFQADTEQYLKLGNHGESINPALIPEGYDYIVLKAGDNGAASTLADAEAAEIPKPVTKYTITFANYDGTTLYTVEVNENETPAYVGETPVKAADAQYTYTFAGWGEIAPATENATYTATYTETVNKYTITYVVDGVETTEEVEYGATPAPEAPVKEGFTFTGWTPEIVAVVGPATYTANFEEIIPDAPAVKVTFVNGAETVEVEAKDGVAIAPAAPTAPTPGADALISGYVFADWVDEKATVSYVAGAEVPATEAITLYARYTFRSSGSATRNILCGDVNLDGRTNAADVNQMLYKYKNDSRCTITATYGKALDSANMTNVKLGDANGDTRVNAADVNQMLYKYKNDTRCTIGDMYGKPLYFINK